MAPFSIAERVFLIRTFWVTGSITETQKQFKKKYGRKSVPADSTIRRLAQKLESSGSVLKCHGGGRAVVTPTTVRDVRQRLLQSPRKSLRRLAQETGLTYSSCQKAAKKARIHPYRVTAVQELLPRDNEKRRHYCEWFQELIAANEGILEKTFFTDEAWFHLSGYVNSQNSRYWATEKPHVHHETPLHSQKIGVWCAVTSVKIVGPIFFGTTLNTDRYLENFNVFVNLLDDNELASGYFQQDNATCHTSLKSMECICSFFEERVISKGLWPPRSPDLTSPDFYLWGYLKERVYRNNPRDIDTLKANITASVSEIDVATLRKVSANMVRRVELCLDADGSHFESFL